MFLRPTDPEAFAPFVAALGHRDPQTVAAYLGTLRGLVAWLATRPGRQPFRLDLLTEVAIQDYLDYLAALQRAPRTRSRALTAIHRFCHWAVDAGLLRRDPTTPITRPTVAALAPQELTPDQRFVLKSLVERADSARLSAIFALAYWAGLRISEVANLQLAHCTLNQRTGALTILDAKGGKTRTLDLPNPVRRALYTYIYTNPGAADARDPQSRYVFTSQRAAWLRQQQRPDQLSPRGIEHLWQHAKAHATHEEWILVGAVRFHTLRHDWAHRARAAGWSLEEIAVYAGHQTRDGAPAIATTARYTLPSREQLRRLVQVLPG
jgi:site-specific recombinase XerD